MWTLSEQRAELTAGPLRLQVDVSHVQRGLTAICIAGHDWTQSQLLTVQLPSRRGDSELVPLEAYVRGSDLVATYPPLPPFTIQPQIYWHVRQEPSLVAVGIELIVSVQTSQLYSEPQTPIVSSLAAIAADAVWVPGDRDASFVPARLPQSLSSAQRDDGMVACAIPGSQHVYVEMIHPSDLDAMTIEAKDHTVRVVCQVFQEHLEKGVIRRARACGWFLPATDWQARAWSLYRSYRQERPPLTA